MAKNSSGNGEWDTHIVATRFRLNGEGDLQLELTDLDNVQSLDLVAIPMLATTRFEPTRLANFQSQRTRLVGTVELIDEWFDIGRIIIWAKPVAIEYPNVT